MKILISADMEGISGVVNWDQVEPSHPEYSRFRRIMTGDVNAAVQGAFDGGAMEFIVADGHHDGHNILLEELDPRAQLNSGLATAPFSMMQGLEDSINGVFFIGYHGRAGSFPAVLDHTWGGGILGVWLNGLLVGEHGLNAALAGHFHVPIIMVSGDQTTCAQTSELVPGLEEVVVKQATGRFSARCLPIQESQRAIREGARRAVTRLSQGNPPKPLEIPSPITVSVEFSRTDQAQRAARLPGASGKDRTVSITAPDMLEAFAAFRGLAALAPVE